MKRILLVVDVQEEFADKEKIVYNKIINYIKENSQEYDYVYATKFMPYGIKMKRLEFSANVTIIKTRYRLEDYDVLSQDYYYELLGFDNDVSMYQISKDMYRMGYNFSILKNL